MGKLEDELSNDLYIAGGVLGGICLVILFALIFLTLMMYTLKSRISDLEKMVSSQYSNPNSMPIQSYNAPETHPKPAHQSNHQPDHQILSVSRPKPSQLRRDDSMYDNRIDHDYRNNMHHSSSPSGGPSVQNQKPLTHENLMNLELKTQFMQRNRDSEWDRDVRNPLSSHNIERTPSNVHSNPLMNSGRGQGHEKPFPLINRMGNPSGTGSAFNSNIQNIGY